MIGTPFGCSKGSGPVFVRPAFSQLRFDGALSIRGKALGPDAPHVGSEPRSAVAMRADAAVSTHSGWPP